MIDVADIFVGAPIGKIVNCTHDAGGLFVTIGITSPGVFEKMQVNALMGKAPTFSLCGQYEGFKAVYAVLDVGSGLKLPNMDESN